jgi:hypothetical protein
VVQAFFAAYDLGDIRVAAAEPIAPRERIPAAAKLVVT